MKLYVLVCQHDASVIGVFDTSEQAENYRVEWWNARRSCQFEDEYIPVYDIILNEEY